MIENAKKFFFDNHDFDEDAMHKQREAEKRPTFSQEEMEASRLTGVEQGRKEGQREAMASLEAQLCDFLQKITGIADGFSTHENARLAAFIDHASLLSAQAITTIVPILDDILSAEQIAVFIKSTLENHAQKSDLIIYVHQSTAEQINTRLTKLKETMPSSGAWSVQAHPELTLSECRIEWAGGGAEWNPKHVHDTLLKTIIGHLPEHLREKALPPAPTAPVSDTEQQNKDTALTQTPGPIDEDEQTPHNTIKENTNEAPKTGDE